MKALELLASVACGFAFEAAVMKILRDGIVVYSAFVAIALLVGFAYWEMKMKMISIPKPPQEATTSLNMVSGAFYSPKQNSWTAKGEDAHFICSTEQTIGVADGVGSWASQGVDSGRYARRLMRNAAVAVRNQPSGAVDPRKVLNEAYKNTNDIKGSSTACIVTLNKDGVLHAVNLGDSGFMVFRNSKLVYQSPTQQHGPNYPYQLGPDSLDRPESAMEIKINWVEGGDVVVVGSDGLFDNVFPSEIEEIIRRCTGEAVEQQPEEQARIIGEVALRNSVNKDKESPFEKASQLSRPLNVHLGGKTDDITVFVAHIIISNSN